jgi:hypothetical protein
LEIQRKYVLVVRLFPTNSKIWQYAKRQIKGDKIGDFKDTD